MTAIIRPLPTDPVLRRRRHSAALVDLRARQAAGLPAVLSAPARPAPRPPRDAEGNRKAALAQIHIAKAQLGLDDDTYRRMLQAVAGVSSSKDLDKRGLDKVLAHLRRAGFKSNPGKGNHPGRPHNISSAQRGPLLKKVEALLADASRPWAYADGMAKKMFGVEKVALLDEHQLHRLVAALMYDQKRRAMKPASKATTEGAC